MKDKTPNAMYHPDHLDNQLVTLMKEPTPGRSQLSATRTSGQPHRMMRWVLGFALLLGAFGRLGAQVHNDDLNTDYTTL